VRVRGIGTASHTAPRGHRMQVRLLGFRAIVVPKIRLPDGIGSRLRSVTDLKVHEDAGLRSSTHGVTGQVAEPCR